MRVIIAGSRHYPPEEADRLVAKAMRGFQVKHTATPTRIISGCATGIDQAGERWAKRNGIPIERHPADWQKHGRRAGPLRNREMARAADAAVIVWDGESAGTRSMIQEARVAGLIVFGIKAARAAKESA